MSKPAHLEVNQHVWSDGWNPHTIVWAIFDESQAVVPEGWDSVKGYCGQHGKVAYEKAFPYGTTVRNGRIIV